MGELAQAGRRRHRDAGKVTTSGSAAPQAYQGAIKDAALNNGIASDLLTALIRAESSFDPGTVSSAGAIGFSQLMPATAKELGVNPNDPVQNIQGGAKYLRQQMNQFGSLELALAAYNAGPGRVRQAAQQAGSNKWEDVKKHLPQETQNYVPKVLGYAGMR